MTAKGHWKISGTQMEDHGSLKLLESGHIENMLDTIKPMFSFGNSDDFPIRSRWGQDRLDRVPGGPLLSCLGSILVGDNKVYAGGHAWREDWKDYIWVFQRRPSQEATSNKWHRY